MKQVRSRLFLLSCLLCMIPASSLHAQKLLGLPGTNSGTGAIGPTIAIDKNDNVFFSDGSRVKKKDGVTGVVTVVAGNGTSGHTGDGGPATAARIDVVHVIAVAPNGDLYIAEWQYNYLRKVDVSTGIITTVAGNGTNSTAVSSIGAPTSIDVDKNGNIYVGNLDCIRRINAGSSGVSLVFGTPGTAGFSPSLLHRCEGIKVDALGNIYFSDASNYRIRKITASTGAVSTIAGTGSSGYSGDNGPATSAQLDNLGGLELDARGNIYVSTLRRVRKITTGGIISTIAGSGATPGNPALCAHPMQVQLQPDGLAMDSKSYLHISSFSQNQVIKYSWELEILDVDINTLCIPGSSTPAVTPKFEVTASGGIAPYTYSWAAATGNTATLSSNSSRNPNITSVTGLASFTLTLSDASSCFAAVQRPFQATFNSNQTFDLAMRDSYYDMLDEPNSQTIVDPNKWDVWASQDLWNRLALDGFTTHQDPCSGSPCTNFMYATVRNVGCVAFNPTTTPATVEYYWTLGGFPETWPGSWNGDPFPLNTSLVIGDHVGTYTLNAIINPGAKALAGISWTPPSPTTYYGSTAKEMDACILARIKDGHNPSDPEGMTITEVPDISTNVRNNNNIVTRNTRVVEVSFYAPQESFIRVGNSGGRPRTFNLEFMNADIANSTLSHYMTVTVALGHNVFTSWVRGGAKGTYAAVDFANETVTFDGTTTMELDNISFGANQEEMVQVTFALIPGTSAPEMHDEKLHFRQTYIDPNGIKQTYGAFNYEVTYTGEGDAGEVVPPDVETGTSGKQPTALKGIGQNNSIQVYPNPANTAVYFQFPEMQTGTLRLIDMAGQILAVKELNQQKAAYIDLRSFPLGVYHYELTSGTRTERGKFVIAR